MLPGFTAAGTTAEIPVSAEKQRLGWPPHVAFDGVHQPLPIDEHLEESEPAGSSERQP